MFILEDQKIKSSRDIDLELYEVIKYCEEYREINLKIGVSRRFNNFQKYPTAFRESEQAYGHSKYFNLGQIFYYDDIEQKERKQILINETELNEFEYILKYGEKSEIKESLDKILNIESNENKEYILDPQLLIIKIANSLINFASSINVNISDIISGRIVEEMLTFKDVNDLKQFIYDAIIKLRDNNIRTQVNRNEKVIEDIYKYIEQNYENPSISLESISEDRKSVV